MQIHLPSMRRDAPRVEIHPHNSAVSQQQQRHLPNWPHRFGDALLAAALAVLPDDYKGVELREGTYIQSEENIVSRSPIPGVGEVIIFQQREGGLLGYVFTDDIGTTAAMLGETAAEEAVFL